MKTNPFIVINNQLFNTLTPQVMTIINITPDSFYADSRSFNENVILEHCQKAIEQETDIIDVGAYSTRPNAEFVSEEEEIKRIKFGLNIIRNKFPQIPISVDTFRAKVAEIAVKEYNVNIINDISAGNLDPLLLPMVAKLNVPYILMHSKGNPQTMQQQTQYQKFIPEILQFFAQKTEQLRQLGFTSDIIIDPGFGFAKTTQQNFELLQHLEQLAIFDSTILVGISRKSMICKTLNITPQQALNGTTVLNTIALQKGARILRVHDTLEAKQAILLYQATFPTTSNS